MIFIGGLQPRTIRVRKLPDGCINCGRSEVYEERVDHYLSLFFVPLIRLKKGRSMIVCEYCGTVSGDSHSDDGFSFTHPRRQCPSCGRDTNPVHRFCPHCGQRL